jgi:ribosomal protein S12 methylthiotransferase
MKKVHLTSLGCSKNLVDSEVLAGQLNLRSYIITEQPEKADLIVLNTCGFIQEAKSESIQAIFEALELKKTDQRKKVLVTGCLSQRYKQELTLEIPEIDAIFGTEDYIKILEWLGEDRFQAEEMYQVRKLTTPKHFAYVKISEGCNHTCSFCAIPAIRGVHRSRTIDSIVSEARMLAEKGVKELILVSQDTSYYGKDIYGKPKIVHLLETLAKENLFSWIRPLYWYPTNFPIEFIHLMNKYNSIIPYLDMPIQHISDAVLEKMRRAERQESLIKLYEKIRKIRPDIVLRTTLIVGHPGEKEKDFNLLKEFIKEIRFDRLGAFIYSDEEGTYSYDIAEKVDKNIARKRHTELMELQQRIGIINNQKLRGTKQNVLIDGYDHIQNFYHGRTYRDCPEIDNEVLISSAQYLENVVGSFKKVVISDTSEYELYGSFNVNLLKDIKGS